MMTKTRMTAIEIKQVKYSYVLGETELYGTKEDIRRMERTLSMNYPVVRQNKRVLLNTFVKNHSLYYFFVYIPSIYPFLPLVLMYIDEI